MSTMELKKPIPKEMIVETLHTTIDFIPHLISLSQALIEPSSKKDFGDRMVRFVEGIELLTDSVNLSKSFLPRQQLPPSLEALEHELLTLLQQLLSTQEGHRELSLLDIVEVQIPTNLQAWQQAGLPILLECYR